MYSSAGEGQMKRGAPKCARASTAARASYLLLGVAADVILGFFVSFAIRRVYTFVNGKGRVKEEKSDEDGAKLHHQMSEEKCGF
jgi:hypothetical protein